MQISNEWQGEIRKSSSVINAKKQREKQSGKDQRAPQENYKYQANAKMGTIKDRNCMVLTDAEDVRRGGKNTQKNYAKEILMMQIITMV